MYQMLLLFLISLNVARAAEPTDDNRADTSSNTMALSVDLPHEEGNQFTTRKPRIFSRSFERDWAVSEYDRGSNIGEYLFYAGAQNLLQKYDLFQSSSQNGFNNDLRSLQYDDIYAIVVSNILHPTSGYWASTVLSDLDIISSKSIQFIVICCGAQAPSSEILTSVDPITVELFQRIYSANPKSIGVRGIYTQNVLKQYGIESTITGCPSIMHNWRFLDRLASLEKPPQIRFSYAGTPSEHFYGYDLLHYLGLQFKGDYISQFSFETGIEDSVDGGNDYIVNLKTWNEQAFICLLNRSKDAEYIRLLEEHGATDHNLESLVSHLKTHTIYPRNYSEWLSAMGNFDLFVGSRIHGCIAALLAGCRALCVVHDSRTLELCQTLNIPYVTKFSIPSTLDVFYDLANPSQFLKNLPLTQLGFLNFLKENNL